MVVTQERMCPFVYSCTSFCTQTKQTLNIEHDTTRTDNEAQHQQTFQRTTIIGSNPILPRFSTPPSAEDNALFSGEKIAPALVLVREI